MECKHPMAGRQCDLPDIARNTRKPIYSVHECVLRCAYCAVIKTNGLMARHEIKRIQIATPSQILLQLMLYSITFDIDHLV